jgi:hypothetical protein
MATSKTTATRAKTASVVKKQIVTDDGIPSLYRKFREANREWRTADKAYTSAVEAAQAKYPKPPGPLERILLLNTQMFNGKVYAPIDKHEAALIELCGRGDGDGNAFNRDYELLTQWRSWRAACQKIDRDHRVAELGPVADGAKKKREAALTPSEGSLDAVSRGGA